MPLIFPTSPSPGDTYTDDNSVVWQFDGVKWDVITGTTKKLYNGVKVKLATPYALNTTLTPVSWPTPSFDTGGYFNGVTPTRLTIPQTGFYNLNSVVFTDSQGAGYEIQILKNGTTEISDGVINANQSAEYNETVFFNAGDYIQLLAKETSDAGSLDDDSMIEITQLGLAVGTGVSNFSAFSGASALLTVPFATTTTPTGIAWSGTEYDTNANSLAVTYWSAGIPTRLTVAIDGFYQINSFIATGTDGGVYTVTLRKNGSTTISTTTINVNDTASIDEIFELVEGDYIEILVSNAVSAGSITTESYLNITRMGV
jgi:hypothetical protein